GAQDLRRARPRGAGRAPARSHRVDRSVQPLAGRLHGRAQRVPRDRDHAALTNVVHPHTTRKDRAMRHTARSTTVIRLGVLLFGAAAIFGVATSPQAGEMHHTVVPADAVTWGPAPPSL